MPLSLDDKLWLLNQSYLMVACLMTPNLNSFSILISFWLPNIQNASSASSRSLELIFALSMTSTKSQISVKVLISPPNLFLP